MMLKVLIAVDSSEYAEDAFNCYMERFHKEDNEVVLLYVIQNPMPPMAAPMAMGAFPVHQFAALVADVQEKAKELMKKYTTLAQQKKVNVTEILRHGNPGEEIIDAAKDKNVGVIVMGSRGLNAIRRTFLGSVSDYVLHHSKIPVLIVPKAI